MVKSQGQSLKTAFGEDAAKQSTLEMDGKMGGGEREEGE